MIALRIFGLNVASSKGNRNGRGWVDPETGEFVYLPIEEVALTTRSVPTYARLGFTEVKYPHLRVHLDPEFESFTYGHVRRFGDQVLFKLRPPDILFFYATLDVLPSRRQWGVYVIGFFDVDHVIDTRGMSSAEVKRLAGFQANAHLQRRSPGVELLVKGKESSRLFRRALRLSAPSDPHTLNPRFDDVLTTVTGKGLAGAGWHRWLMYSNSAEFAELLHENP